MVGAANSVVDVAGFTLLQRTVPDEVLTRVLGVTWGLAMGAVALGSFAAPVLLDAVGLRSTLVAVGAVLPVLVLVLHRRLRRLDIELAPSGQLALIDTVTLFAPLSLAAKQRIAAHLIRVDVEPGEVVFSAGEAGDRFYVVVSGTLEIDLGARTVRVGPGDFFGEIALLRQVPRTGTVTAETTARLVALDREHFLTAVTGHPQAHSEAEAVAAARLAGA
jgi:MFS family permease